MFHMYISKEKKRNLPLLKEGAVRKPGLRPCDLQPTPHALQLQASLNLFNNCPVLGTKQALCTIESTSPSQWACCCEPCVQTSKLRLPELMSTQPVRT